MVGFCDLVGVAIVPLSKNLAVKSMSSKKIDVGLSRKFESPFPCSSSHTRGYHRTRLVM